MSPGQPAVETIPNEIVPDDSAPTPAAMTTAEVVEIGSFELPPAPNAAHRGLAGPGLWIRVGLALALFTASAVARQWQASRVNQTLRSGRIAPFALEDIPTVLGDWEKSDATTIDPYLTRNTGAVESVFRTYQHRRTGQKIQLIALFGPSTEMYVHTPVNCYAAGGYISVRNPLLHQISAGNKQYPFLAAVYAKGEESTITREECYWTWYYAGQWTPNLVTEKKFERIPGMFKVHVQRPVQKQSELDLLEIGNPTEAFLKMLMPQIDARINKSMSQTTAAKTPKKS
jgi:hypothetical protein